MSKVLKTAAIVVGVAALAITTAGAAVAIGTAGVGLSGGIATVAGAVGLTSLGLSVSTLGIIGGGLSFAAALTAKKPQLASAGTQTNFQTDPDGPMNYGIGRTFIAGRIAHQASSGASNELMHLALLWSFAGPIDSFETFTVDNQAVTFGAGGAAIGAYAGFMWLKTQLGAAPEAAALTPGSGSMPGWGATAKLSGYAAGVWTLKYDKKGKVFAAGVPKAGMVAKWTRVYDARRDSSYPGGSGAQRPLIETTYAWSDNPWTHALTWALGRLQNGQYVFGARHKFDSIDVASFVEAANVADANAWKIGGMVTSADDPWQVLKAMCQAGGGEPIRIGAQLSCIVNTPRVSLGTLTAADLVGPPTITATQSRRDRINGIIGKYRSEDHAWEVVSAAPVRIAEYVAFDGRRRTREVTYSLVQCFAGAQPVQVAQLAAYDIYNAREIPAITTPLKVRFVGVKPGDCWTLNIPEAGLHNQPCILRMRSLDVARGVPTLTWRSETAAKHAAALGKTTTPPPTPTLGLVNLGNVAPPGVGAWTATGTTLTANGVSVPVIKIVGAVDNPAAEAVLFEYRPAGSSTWIAASTEDANATSFELTRVTSDTQYDIAVSYRVRNVVGARRVLASVTTGDWSGTEGPPGRDGTTTWNPIAITGGFVRVGGSFTGTGVGFDFRSVESFAQARVTCQLTSTSDGLGVMLFDPVDNTCFELLTNSPWGSDVRRHWWGISQLPTGVTVTVGLRLEVAHIGTDVVGFIDGVNIGVIRAGVPADRALHARWRAPGSDTLSNCTFSRAGNPGLPGASALTGYLTNETHTLPADKDGNVLSYDGASGSFEVLLGSADVTAQCTFVNGAYSPTTGWSSTLNAETGHYGIGSISAGVGSGWVDTIATHTPTGQTITKRFSWSKSKTGEDGTPPALISIAASSNIARYNGAGAYTGGPVTFSARKQNAAAPIAFAIYRVSDNALLAANTAAGYALSYPAYFSSTDEGNLTFSITAVQDHMGVHGPITIRAYLNDGSDIGDSTTLGKAQDGTDGLDGVSALSGYLTNESHTVPADVNGNVSTYAGASGSFKVLLGTNDVTAGCTFSIVSNPQNLSVPNPPFNVGNYTVDGGFDAGEAAATVTFRATHTASGQVIDRVFSLAKSKAGGNGISPPLIKLSTTSFQAKYDQTNDYVGGPITYTAVIQNSVGTAVFTIRNAAGTALYGPAYSDGFAAVPGGLFTTTGYGNLTITASGVEAIVNAYGGTEGRLFIDAYPDIASTVIDRVSLNKVKDGEDGEDGLPGENGFTIAPGVADFSINCSSNGTPKSGEFNKTVTFKVLRGVTDISDDPATTYTASFAGSGWNGSFGGTNGKALTLTGITAQTAKLLVTVSHAGVAIGKIDVSGAKKLDGSAANYGQDDTLAPMPNSTSFFQLGSFVLTVANNSTLTMNAAVQWFAASGTYPGRIQLSYTVDGAENFSATANGDITATTAEQAIASISGFQYQNLSGVAKGVTVKLYGRRISGAGASSGTSGSVEGSGG